MEQFLIIPPSPLLAPYVKNYWVLRTVCNCPSIVRTVPTGMMSLVFHRGDSLLSSGNDGYLPRAFMAGQEQTFDDLHYAGHIDMVSVVFTPVGVRAFFDLPLNLMRGLRLTAEDLQDKQLRELSVMIADTPDDRLCIQYIEKFLSARLRDVSGPAIKRLDAAVGLINAGHTGVGDLSDAACLGKKQFQRIFSQYVGSNPKQFSRTVRFQKALYILSTRPCISLTALAYECGYFDQSHMVKDFRALSGSTPGEYLARWTPYSDYFY